MLQKSTFFLRAGAIFSVLGIACGAFGAHALEERLATAQMTSVWETAVLYHLIHGVALVLLAALASRFIFSRWVGYCWIAGILFFSGSLYVLALGGPRVLGPITPLGGLFLMAGWVLLALAKGRDSASS